MYVGIARLTLIASQCHSLKEKRAVVRKLKDRVRAHYRVPLSEVASQDTWQRIVFGLAIVGGERARVDTLLGEIVRYVVALGEREGLTRLASDEREIVRYSDEPFGSGSAAELDDEASARSASAEREAASDGWVPEAWRSKLDE